MSTSPSRAPSAARQPVSRASPDPPGAGLASTLHRPLPDRPALACRPAPHGPHAPHRPHALPAPCPPARGRARVVALALVALVGLGAAAWAYRHGAATGDARSAMAAGHFASAARRLTPLAAAGDPVAQTALGNLHYLGLGVARDPRRAAELYFEAARHAHAPAQINLGNLYSQGLGVPSDALRAFGWYRQADVHGSPVAEYYLRQISLEYTLSPLQQSTAAAKWDRLDALVAEGL